MKIYLDCYPCFFHQALKTARLVVNDEKILRRILLEVGALLPRIPPFATPPEIGREVYRIVTRIAGIMDPYRDIKSECTRRALALYPELNEMVREAADPLRMAVRAAVAGNIIDFGVKAEFDLERDLVGLLSRDFAIDHYETFRQEIKRAKKILYLADNAGETVFDRLLLEQLPVPVVYAVRSRPVINDAVADDAVAAGIVGLAEIISSGSDAPGTLLSLCSREFLRHYETADLIISKGQGNYEGLSQETRPIYFLLRAKCSVISRDIGVNQGDIVLKRCGWDEKPPGFSRN